jgi:hypothetical protein
MLMAIIFGALPVLVLALIAKIGHILKDRSKR